MLERKSLLPIRTLRVLALEISLYGCFLKFPISLSPGTPAFVKIFTESETCEADGTVIYSHPDVGFGFAFRDIKPHLTTMTSSSG
jgi:hypothetical protein